MVMDAPCPFCDLATLRVRRSNAHGILIRDAYPITLGHSLVIPRRHVCSFFEATAEEKLSLLALLDEAMLDVTEQYQPHGFNIGINDGAAAGQTVPHLHIHLIPRYAGDVPDPRGGIRWIIPNKADYWSKG